MILYVWDTYPVARLYRKCYIILVLPRSYFSFFNCSSCYIHYMYASLVTFG